VSRIKLDKGLEERAAAVAKELGYSSLEEFVTHLVERAVREREEQEEQDREAVEKRLRGLGYIE
jgi:Arc/MetJ family transcription regulator